MKAAATLSLEEAADPVWDVAVVGAGVAGSMAAYGFAKRGAKVLLVDKAAFPRWKVCGCCLNGRALDTLDRAGLGDLPAELGAVPLTAFAVASHGFRADLRFPRGVAVSREALDTGLAVRAIEAGASFLPETSASLGACTETTRGLQLHRGESRVVVRARTVVAATGLSADFLNGAAGFRSVAEPASRVGAGATAGAAPEFYARGAIYMACEEGGYVGVVRRQDGKLNIAAAFDKGFLRAFKPGAATARILEAAGFAPVPGIEALPWKGTPALTRTTAQVAGRRLFVLGDAAGYVEPFTGEGMAWGLSAGLEIAEVVLPVIDAYTDRVERAWTEQFAKIVRDKQRLCRWTSRGLRRPAVVRVTIKALRRAPMLARPVMHYVNAGPKPRKVELL